MSPSASSALVNVAEDAELRLVRLLAQSAEATRANFVEDCEAFIHHGDAANLMRTILAEKAAVAALVSLEEGVSAVSLLAALLDRAKNVDNSQLVDELADCVVEASSTTDASMSIALLATLYNMRTNPNEKVRLLVKMLRLASASKPSLLESHASMLGKWTDPSKLSALLDDWKIESSARRDLYRAAADGASSPVAKQRFILLIVETYDEKTLDKEGIEYAQKAAVGAIQDPVSLFNHQKNILSLPAIQALEKNSAPLLSLLKVFQEGKLQDYHDFIKSNGGDSVLAQWDLSPETCSRHMRILSLCSLAAEQEEIPYTLVAEALQTTQAEVEAWVIAAVSSGLLSAKMDQLEEKVIVERCVVRKFDMEQWKVMQARLKVWKENVGGILQAYKESLQQQ